MSGWESFESHTVHVESEAVPSGVDIFCRKKGSGPGLLLLHGYPQTHHIWVKIANQLAEKYTVVVTDLRGYGASSKPRGSETHVEYCKKEMASDQVQVMTHFGIESFYLVGHDRGARVAHRLSLDYPEKVKKLMVLDILPTLWMYEHTDMQFATGYFHWFFLIQKAPGPEEVILASKEAYWRLSTGRVTHSKAAWSDETVQLYKDAWFTPECLHGTCEDYRAAATIDLEHDRESLKQGQKLIVPEVKVIWGQRGMIEKMGHALDVWRGYSEDKVKVSGRSYDCGHYIPEEKPEELLQEILEFMQ